jgi:uncharacterized membrane protein YgdD (TMEM256/DUF423 family)
VNPKTCSALLTSGSIFAALGVALGAFGAHGLKNTVSPELIGTFETGVRYEMYHAFGLVVAGLLCRTSPEGHAPTFRIAGWFFGLGIVLFSGSLYFLVLFDLPWLGAITPLGGLAFIAGWIALGYATLR